MSAIVRAGVICVSASLLSACLTARDPYVTYEGTSVAGNWRIERQVDPVTRAPLSSSLVMTRKSSHSGEDFTKPALLQLTCFRNAPLIRLAFDVRVGSTRNAMLGYSFDDGPGREAKTRFLQDFRTVVIEDSADVALFARELAGAKVLRVRIRTLNAGRTLAEFDVEGAPTAIKYGFAECPPSNDPPLRQAVRRR